MLKVTIEPLETVFFRDHRPFEAGVDALAGSILPSPLTVFGFIGASYLEKKGVSIEAFRQNGNEKLGPYDPTLNKTKMKIKGPFFSYRGRTYFPPPASLWSSGNNTRVHYLLPRAAEQWHGSWDGSSEVGMERLRPLVIPVFTDKNSKQPEPLSEYLSDKGIQHFLRQERMIVRDFTEDEETLFESETRFGIASNKEAGTAESGYLYRARHLRFREHMHAKDCAKASFVVFVDGLDLGDLPEGIARFGGEGRNVSITSKDFGITTPFPLDKDTIEKICERKKLCIYFLTPSIFKEGWHNCLNIKDFRKLSLAGAAVNKPLFISGWSRSGTGAGGNPRHLFKAIPAGSVYFYEIQGEWLKNDIEYFYNKYHFNESISDYYRHAGFGTVLVRVW